MREERTALIEMQWDISASGRAEAVHVAAPSGAEATRGGACLRKAFEAMRFPTEGAPVRGVKFPIRAMSREAGAAPTAQ
jgi:hypothetical protein